MATYAHFCSLSCVFIENPTLATEYEMSEGAPKPPDEANHVKFSVSNGDRDFHRFFSLYSFISSALSRNPISVIMYSPVPVRDREFSVAILQFCNFGRINALIFFHLRVNFIKIRRLLDHGYLVGNRMRKYAT